MKKIFIKNPSPRGEGFLFVSPFINEVIHGVRLWQLKLNRMIKKIIALLLFCTLSFVTSAQTSFVVYSAKGDVTISTDKKMSRPKAGTIATTASIVQVKKGGAISFICEKGNTFSLVKPGNFTLDKYADSCVAMNPEVLSAYLLYIRTHAIEYSHTDPGHKRRNYFPGYVLVMRYMQDIWIDPMFDTIRYYLAAGNFPLTWKAYGESDNKFQVSLYDTAKLDFPFYRTTVNGFNIPFDSLMRRLKLGGICYWGIARPNEEDMLQVLFHITKEEHDKTIFSVKASRPGFEGAAEESFRMGFMLEHARYFPEAYKYYKKAVLLDPKNKLYSVVLASFRREYEVD